MENETSQLVADQSKTGKILLWILGLLIVASIGATYWRIMIKKDYVIEAQVDCDPHEKACFVWQCDPASTVEGEACTGDPESDTWYFSVAARTAANIPLCDSETDENCDPWTCEEGEKDCSETFCSEELMEAQYASACVDPVQFAIDNPVEEEAIECDEGDEECLAAQAEEAIECDPSAAEAGEGDEECLAAEESEDAVCDPEQDPTCVEDETATVDTDVNNSATADNSDTAVVQ